VSTRNQLIERWKVEPWLSVDKWLYEFCVNQGAQHWSSPPDAEFIFERLGGLPFREEVPGGRDLRGSSFLGASKMDLHETDFSYCHSIDWFQNCNLVRARVENIRRSFYSVRGHLVETSFQRTRLQKTWLNDSRFERCDFAKADLRSAIFRGSDLRGSIFRDANCEGADFQECNVIGCDFRGANLSEAMFRAVTIDETADLRGAKLFDLVNEELRDYAGSLVLPGTDWRQATYDETTVTGTRSGSVDLKVLDLIIKEAKLESTAWSKQLAGTAEQFRKIIKSDPNFRWYEALLESVEPVFRVDAERLIERASMKL
jgi:uncharacterized protein YjbI with pentapeptide repeats